MTDDLDKLARGLSNAAKRTLTEKPPEWVCSWNAQGHQFLTSRGIVEHITGNCGRLTPLGLALKAHIERNEG